MKNLPKYLNIVSLLTDRLEKLESTSRPTGFFKLVGNNELKFFHRHYDRSLLPDRFQHMYSIQHTHL